MAEAMKALKNKSHMEHIFSVASKKFKLWKKKFIVKNIGVNTPFQ